MNKTLILSLLIAPLAACGAWADDQRPVRKWLDASGKHEVRARFDSYDPERRTATIINDEGIPLEIPLSRLSRRDQRYVLATVADNKKAPQPNAIARKERAPRGAATRGPGLRQSGLVWHQNVKAALNDATGNATPDDDRPIMWFRVLGDLSGFM